MKWRGLPFTGPMVTATRAGLKTETRRVVRNRRYSSKTFFLPRHATYWRNDQEFPDRWHGYDGLGSLGWLNCPYGVPGDGLYVREAWKAIPSEAEIVYQADGEHIRYLEQPNSVWEYGIGHRTVGRPSIHMPRWASRQGLILTDVAVERVQDIDEAGANAEGVPDQFPAMINGKPGTFHTFDKRYAFGVLWEGINGKRGYGWQANPWVWRLRYELTDELPPPLVGP